MSIAPTQQGDKLCCIGFINAALCYDTLKDYQKAVQWYTKSAEQGIAEAQYQLGSCYDMGEGVPEDPKMAVKWYTKAAEQGHNDAMYFLAVFYEKGTGVPKDMQKAREWMTKLSAKGDGRAKTWLEKH